MKYLKMYNEEFLGVIGEPTDMTYADGSIMHIGDVITELVDVGYKSTRPTFVTNEGVMGLCGHKFKNGQSYTWKIISHKKFNEHLETKLGSVSIHEATIHDIAVKCNNNAERSKVIRLMAELNNEKMYRIFFCDENNYYNVIIENGKVGVSEYVGNKIIIDYPTFIKHFYNTKLEVEIKQIDNVVLKRVINGNRNLLPDLIFLDYPNWTAHDFTTVQEAEDYIKHVNNLVNSINNPQSKLYDSIGQELHEGDKVEFISKENFDLGIRSSKIFTINGKLAIGLTELYTMILPEEIDNTKLYIRKVK